MVIASRMFTFQRDLGEGGRPDDQDRTDEEPAHLERQIGDGQEDGDQPENLAVNRRPASAGGERQRRHEHRRKQIAQHDQIEDAAADIVRKDHRIADDAEPEHDRTHGQGGDDQRAAVMDDAAGPFAQPFKADGHREPDVHVQRDLGERAGPGVDIAAGHVVAHLEEGEQHREQERGRICHPRRGIVGTPAQDVAAEPERRPPGRRSPITAS